MVKKVILNILLNVALFTLAASFYWAVAHGYYPMASFIVVVFGMFVYFKILLAKAVKDFLKEKAATKVQTKKK